MRFQSLDANRFQSCCQIRSTVNVYGNYVIELEGSYLAMSISDHARSVN